MKVLIVGGVAGGAGAAARLRRNDEQAEIILFEKGAFISFANCGLPYFIGGAITDRGQLQLQTPEAFRARFHVDVRVMHEVTGVDSASKTVSVLNHATGETYTESYDKLILSPGASPIRPRFPGLEDNHVFTLRNIPDTYAIYDHIEKVGPKTAAVIGAGFIGLEMAENLAERGLSVSIVEAAPHVMAPMDLDMAHMVHNRIRAAALHKLRHSGACHYGNHADACRLPHFHVLARVSGACRDHLNALVHDNLCNGLRLRIHQHDVDTKWFLCRFLHFPNLFPDKFRRRAARTDDSKPAGLGNCRSQIVLGNPCHAALYNGIFNS